MELSVVTEAVRTLRARGERVSVRAVHTLIGGGSFRDISRYLRDAREFLADDELTDLEAEEVVESSPRPSLGRIVEAFQAAELALHEAGVASASLDEKLGQLRWLVAHPPEHATVPADVAESVDAWRVHRELVSQTEEEAHQLERIVQSHQAAAIAFRAERNKLYMRAQELRDAILPSGRRSLVEAQQHLTRLKADLIHAVGLAERRVEVLGQALLAYEAELAMLTGEATR